MTRQDGRHRGLVFLPVGVWPSCHRTSMVSELQIDVRRSPNQGSVVAPVGDLDLSNASALQQEVARVLEAGEPALVVDLRGLRFMDSTGLRALLAVNEACDDHGCDFAVIKGPNQVQRLLTITHVAERLTILEGEPAGG
jgi:anti-sigma B factor antagonist